MTHRRPGRQSRQCPQHLAAGEELRRLERQQQAGGNRRPDVRTTEAHAAGSRPDEGCLEMCPEIERLRRQVERRLSPFEVDKELEAARHQCGIPNCPPLASARTTIKEYSRSAAGKSVDRSLLRPPEVLWKTASHLCTAVLDAHGRPTDSMCAAAYAFAWDRLRCLRQDIAMQELADEDTAAVLESAVRFHVLYAYWLRGQPVAAFDPAINEQHLRESLHMALALYEKRRERNALHRPTPAELEMYTVSLLIDLGQAESEAARLAMQLPAAYSTSAPVRRAIELQIAVWTNNFRFVFQSMRDATWLEACLLHRWACSSGWPTAVAIMTAAYASANTRFPLADVAEWLALDSEHQAADLCETYGVSVEAPHVLFRRGAFKTPASPLAVACAVRLMSSKLEVCAPSELLLASAFTAMPADVAATDVSGGGDQPVACSNDDSAAKSRAHHTPSFATPDLEHLSTDVYENVYEAAEDSFLLLDALEKDAERLLQLGPHCQCVEIGSGSGIGITFLGQVLGPQAKLFATDINPNAVAATVATAERNHVELSAFNCDLTDGLPPELMGAVDVAIFNPPYVVTPSDEVGGTSISAAWAGGIDGREVIDRALPQIERLLSEGGLFYMVVLKENLRSGKAGDLRHALKDREMSVILERRSGPERLMVVRYSK